MYRVCGLAWLLICIHTPIIDICFFFLVIQTFSVYLVVHNYQHNLPRYSLIPGAYEQWTYPADLLSSFPQGDVVCWSSMRSCKYAAHEQYCAMNSCMTGCYASVGCIFLPLVTVETRMKVTCSGVGSISWLVRRGRRRATMCMDNILLVSNVCVNFTLKLLLSQNMDNILSMVRTSATGP